MKQKQNLVQSLIIGSLIVSNGAGYEHSTWYKKQNAGKNPDDLDGFFKYLRESDYLALEKAQEKRERKAALKAKRK